MSIIGDGAQGLLDLLFPPRCVSCGATGALLCATCITSVRPPAPPLCRRCGRSLAAFPATERVSLCPICATGREDAHLDGLRAASIYDGAVRQAILALKFRRQRRVAHPLARLLAACYREEGLAADLIVPIPLHATRRRERGFDQAHVLARLLAAQLHVPVRADLLLRARATRAQMSLSAVERRTNVAGAFVLASPAAHSVLAGKRVLLVDDVTTTGSTLEAATAALREANPASIWGLAVARPELETQDGDDGGVEMTRNPRRKAI